jgi:hypothetical protein
MQVFEKLEDHLGVLEGVKQPFHFAFKLSCDFRQYVEERGRGSSASSSSSETFD